MGEVLKIQIQWPEKMTTSEELAGKHPRHQQTNAKALGLEKQQEGHHGWRSENEAKCG